MNDRFLHHSHLLIQPWTLGFFPVLLIEYLSLSESLAQACAMCQTVMPGSNDPMAQGLFWGVLILLVAPFLVVGTIGGWLYYYSRTIRSSSTVTAQVKLLSCREHTQDQK